MPLVKYASRDFDAVKEDMVSQVPVLAPAWTNLNEGDLGMALINLVAGAVDMLSFYLDRQAEEVFLPTAISRDAVQRLVRLIDYRLSRPVAAKTTLRFSLPEPAGEDLVIPKYTVCRTLDGMQFVTKEDAVLFMGTDSVDVEAYQGEYVTETFTATGEDVQTYQLARPNAAQNFLDLYVGSEMWREDTFELSPGETRVFEVNTDANEIATIRFSRFLGDVPEQNRTITVHYIETRGRRGNIGSGLVTRIVSLIPGGEQLTVTNIDLAKGGRDRETVDEAKTSAPRHLRMLGRIVTLKDFEDALETFPGIAQAQAINHHGYVELYAVPRNAEKLYVEAPQPTVVAVSGETSLAPGTYYVAVTAKDAWGETSTWEYNPSDREVISRIRKVDLGNNQRIRVTIPETEGAAAYNVYLGQSEETLRLALEDQEAGEVVLTEMPVGDRAAPPSKNTTGVRANDSSRQLKGEVEEHLERLRLIGCTFALFNPTYVPVSVEAFIRVYDNYSRNRVRQAVESALAQFLSPARQEFGQDVYISDLYETVMNVEGVRTVRFSTPDDDVIVEKGQIATLGTVSLTMDGGVV